MTATSVRGLSVLASEPVESPLTTPARTIYYIHIVKLLLEDGSVEYGCTECTFTSPKIGTAKSHWVNQCPANPKSMVNGGMKKRRSDYLGPAEDPEDLAAMLDTLLSSDRASTRAVTLEAQVRDLEKLIEELRNQVKGLNNQVMGLKAESSAAKRQAGQWRQRAEKAEGQILKIKRAIFLNGVS